MKKKNCNCDTYAPNPIGMTGWLLGALLVGGAYLVFRKKDEPKQAAVPPPAPMPPITSTKGAWINWDGCFYPGRRYRIGIDLAQYPGLDQQVQGQLDTVKGQLDKIGFALTNDPYVENSFLFYETKYSGPETCGAAIGSLPGYSFQEWQELSRTPAAQLVELQPIRASLT